MKNLVLQQTWTNWRPTDSQNKLISWFHQKHADNERCGPNIWRRGTIRNLPPGSHLAVVWDEINSKVLWHLVIWLMLGKRSQTLALLWWVYIQTSSLSHYQKLNEHNTLVRSASWNQPAFGVLTVSCCCQLEVIDWCKTHEWDINIFRF